jgi:hypothetical protein
MASLLQTALSQIGPSAMGKKCGKYKMGDERFYSYWVPGLVELIFPDWC